MAKSYYSMKKEELIKKIEEQTEEIADAKNELANLEKYKQYADMADELHGIYRSFINSGFTNDQAFELLNTLITQQMELNRKALSR